MTETYAPRADFLPQENLNAVLKTSTRVLVKACGGVEHAARFTRVQKTNLSDYCNPETALFMPIDIVLDLERASGSYAVTEALCAMHGCALHRPSLSKKGFENLTAAIASVMSETGDVLKETSFAQNDGSVSVAEMRRIAGQAVEAIGSLSALVQCLHKKTEGA